MELASIDSEGPLKSDQCDTRKTLFKTIIRIFDSNLFQMNRLFLLLFGMVTFVAHAQVPDYVPTDGLVAWYPFNGNANDESGNGNDGVVMGAELIADRFGNASAAYSFDGYSRIVAPNLAVLNGAHPRSVNAYFISDSPIPTTASSYLDQTIVAQGYGAGGPVISLLVVDGDYDGRLSTQTGSWQNEIVSENPVSDGAWHMATLTYGGFDSPVKLYLDGVLQAQTDSITINTYASSFYIGDAPWGVLFFDGIIDDVAVWNHALSDEAIFSLYAENPVSYGCIDPTACNFDDEATWSDGSCEYGCNYCGPGTHWVDSVAACLPSPSTCAEGTIWDASLQACVGFNNCPSDLDGDGLIGAEDLLSLLSDFGTDCVTSDDPETSEWTCGDPVSYHGYDYATVQIGEQCWFAENLRTEHYANGDEIPGELSSSEWSNTFEGAQAVYANEASNLADYGRLYNWYAVDDERGLCSTGWHVPTDGEFTTLTDGLGGESVAGEKLKSSSEDSLSWDGTNASGFSALAGGYRNYNGLFLDEGSHGYFWSSSPNGADAWARLLLSGNAGVDRRNDDRRSGFSVRCVQD